MLRSLTAGIVLAFAGSRANVARTILSCTGIVVGVGALVLVVSASDFGQRFATAYSEANAGRPATLEVSVFDETITDRAAFEEDLVRAGGQEVSLYQTPAEPPMIRSGDSVITEASILGVDPTLGDIRRMNMLEGRWFTDADTASLAPVMIVNEELGAAVGDLAQVQVGTDRWMDVRVIGVLESSAMDSGWYSAYVLRSPATEDLIFGSGASDSEEESEAEMMYMMGSATTYQVRIDPEDPAADDPWGTIYTERLGSASWRWGVEDQASISSYRSDYAEMTNEAITYLSWALMGIAAITLTTGLLGVLNVGLVTVRERRRELATYRALGASRFTLFVAVVMESVVVSLVAGLIAIAGCWAVLAVGGAVLDAFVPLPDDIPLNIPPTGVLVGLGSAALVGLLAGIIPAMRALGASVVAGLRE
ncbi:ABC transporter permease [Nocardiopsis sp. CT-R113]|uniref:ABC transporter permease n=1 Tax=Nocardiopsis codii TaxID=3065942 RepID=A0ABU7K8U0_9ACTN|nr:ABC transporter permease [Nocardiopsis sp. CT-R113]MEE2038650.1 ABC transporter permease [Nocardiopsis sp. CT-R113]